MAIRLSSRRSEKATSAEILKLDSMSQVSKLEESLEVVGPPKPTYTSRRAGDVSPRILLPHQNTQPKNAKAVEQKLTQKDEEETFGQPHVRGQETLAQLVLLSTPGHSTTAANSSRDTASCCAPLAGSLCPLLAAG